MSEEKPTKSYPWTWTGAKYEAAQLIAEDYLTNDEIAERLGITRDTIQAWKRNPVFMAKVQEAIQELGTVASRQAIGKVSRRLERLQQRWDAMHKVIEERAADEKMRDVPGGKTGLMVHDVKQIGGGEHAERVDLYEVDTALLQQILNHEKQAAQELGQWIEKTAEQGSMTLEIVEEIVDGHDKPNDPAPSSPEAIPPE